MSTTDENMKIATYKMAHAKIDKFYQNSKNNIEDPLFTGFTFDIDTLNSPLFFALCEKEYVESLRSSAAKQPAELDLMQCFSHSFHNEHFLPQYYIFQLQGEGRQRGRIRLAVL